MRRHHARTPAVLGGSLSSPTFATPFPGLAASVDQSVPQGIGSAVDLELNLDADEVFSRSSVRQVRDWENKAKHAQDDLSASLCTLVSERYRDMLGTASTVIGMAESGNALCNHLQDVKHRIQQSAASILQSASTKGISTSARKNKRLSVQPASRRFSTLSLNSEIRTPAQDQALQAESDRQHEIAAMAFKLKLLLDAPEDMWRSVERGNVLQAAWIWTIARVVWSDVGLKDGEKDTGDQTSRVDVKTLFPFISRQWAALTPMRKQVVNRATEFLGIPGGTHDTLSYQGTLSSIQAIVLLESASLSNTLSSLLSQRGKALRDIVRAHTAEADSQSRKEISDTMMSPTAAMLTHLVQCYIETVLQALRAYVLPDPSPKTGEAKFHLRSLVEEMMQPADELQAAESTPSADIRSRRMSQYSLTPVAQNGVPLRTTTSRRRQTAYSTIASLSSGTLFLRYLPRPVLAHTPYIDVTSSDSDPMAPSAVLSRIGAFANETLPLFEGETSGANWTQGIQTISQMTMIQVSVRRTLARAERRVERLLSGVDIVEEARSFAQGCLDNLRAAIDKGLSARLQVIYTSQLSRLSQNLLDGLSSTLVDEGRKPETVSRPLALLLADETHEEPKNYDKLMQLDSHLDVLPPSLATIVGVASVELLEVSTQMANYLKQVAQGDASTTQTYNNALQDMHHRIVAGLQSLLRNEDMSARAAGGEAARARGPAAALSERQSLLVGQLALRLSETTAFYPDTPHRTAGNETSRSEQQAALHRIWTDSLTPWSTSAVENAVGLYGQGKSAASEGPSLPLLRALMALSTSTYSLGPIRPNLSAPICKDLLARFRAAATISSATDKIVLTFLNSPDTAPELPGGIKLALLRHRLLLAPLLTPQAFTNLASEGQAAPVREPEKRLADVPRARFGALPVAD